MCLIHINPPIHIIIKPSYLSNHIWYLEIFKSLTVLVLNYDMDWNYTWTHWKTLWMTCSTPFPSPLVLFYTTFSVFHFSTTGLNNRAKFVLSEESVFLWGYFPSISPGNLSLLHVSTALNPFQPSQLIIWSPLKIFSNVECGCSQNVFYRPPLILPSSVLSPP